MLALASGVVEISACGVGKCPDGQTNWQCTILPTECHMALVNNVCAGDEASAVATANAKAVATLKLRDQNVVGTTCLDTGSTNAPPYGPLDDPQLCSIAMGDNVCLACAKASCCSDYQACSGDANCVCWIQCKASGNTDTTCATSAFCGALDAVSSSAAACLDANCAPDCGLMTTGSSDCTDTTSSSSSGGGGGTTGTSCLPGSSGPGESCFSDGDCTSCECDTQTMTCA